MSHSNRVREFLLTDDGVKLLEWSTPGNVAGLPGIGLPGGGRQVSG
jgi:hypothetical protein